ncbi:MAG: FAD-binding oxidoreductase [Lentisphaerae bacterium]|nr:FAD-binding oxidoreductase [Lentisphaerota bacterium]
MISDGVKDCVAEDYPEYLRDESRKVGRADSLSFPQTEDELKTLVKELNLSGTRFTVQGARTGITGGSVPDGGCIINVSRMNRILGMHHGRAGESFVLTVQPGVLLVELNAAIRSGEFDTVDWSADSLAVLDSFRKAPKYFFPPDPTEDSASIGGMVACNASGAKSLLYGPTRSYVQRLRVVLSDGSVVDLKRGAQFAEGRVYNVTTTTGVTINGKLPTYKMPDVKNAAGYYVTDNMDLLDLFIGSEGTLGIITEIDLLIVRLPEERWGVMIFLPTEKAAINLVERLRSTGAKPASIEFFDKYALSLLNEQRRINPAFGALPEAPDAGRTAIYVEYHDHDTESVESSVIRLSEIMLDCGGEEEKAWVFSNDREMMRLKQFRHAVPEAVNLLIDARKRIYPELTKLGTDLAVPDAGLRNLMDLYDKGLNAAELKYVKFGHIGNNHIHVNIIPSDPEEYRRGKEIYMEWARAAVKMGGTVSAEHGIGKLKKTMLLEMYGTDGIKEMLALKRTFDRKGLLNRGNLFDFV